MPEFQISNSYRKGWASEQREGKKVKGKEVKHVPKIAYCQ